MKSSLFQRVSPQALLALLATVGCAAPASVRAQPTNIDTAQPFYLASDLGTAVNPVFEGGVLKTDQAGGSYGQGFTLDGSATNTIDQAGAFTTFSGVFSDAVSGTPGNLVLTNSATGGGVTFTGFNAYAGATTIGNAASLSLSGSGSIASSSGVNLTGATAVFDVSGVTVSTQIKALSGVAGSSVRLGSKGLTVDQASATIFAGDISGNASNALIKAGVGTLTLSGANSYTNATTISGGTLALAGAGTIANSSVVDVGGGAIFDISATDAGAAVTGLSGGGDVALGVRTLTLTGASDTFSGAIGGAGGLTVAGGAETLTGINTYTGATTVGGGATLSLSGAGSIAASSGVAVDGAFDISATASGASIQSLSGSGDVILGARTLTLTQASGSFSGEISGTGGLALAGGAQTLTTTNSYTGGTTVSGGVLTLTGAGSLGAASGTLSLSGGVLDLGGTSQTTGALTLNGGAIVDSVGGSVLNASSYNVQGGLIGVVLAGSGALTQSGSGTTVLSAANTYTGGTTISGGTLALTGAGTLGATSGTLTLSGGVLDLGGTRQMTGVLTLNGGMIKDSAGGGALESAAYNIQSGAIGAVLAGSGALTQSGPGATTLYGVNTYTGATTLSGGTLALSGAGSIAASSRLDVAGGARFDISATSAGASIIRLSGAGAVTLGARTLTLTGANDTFGGAIGGEGGVTVAGGRETLAGVNTYAGATTVRRDATLSLSGAGSIAASSDVVADGTFDISAAPAGAAIASLSGGGTVVLGGGNLTLTHAAGSFSGAIGGAGGLVVAGGAETLTGASSYAGGTRVSNASLTINGDAALGKAGSGVTLDNGALTILRDTSSARPILITAGGGAIHAESATVALAGPIGLGGVLETGGSGRIDFSGVAQGNGVLSITEGLFAHNGEISAAGVTVAAHATLRGVGVIDAPTTVAGTLAPGASPGTLTFNAPLTLQATATSAFDIDGPGTGAFSRVVVNGTDGRLTAGGVLAPRLRGITGAASNTYSPAIGRQFRVISAAGGIAADSGFSGLTQPAGLMAGARFDALYAPTSLSLIVTPTAYADLGSAGIAATPNQTAVGASLDASRPAVGLRMSVDRASVYYPLYGLLAAELPAGLEALSPDVYAAGVMAARQAWNQGAAAVGDQLAGRRGAPGSPSASSEGVTLWADAFGQRTEFGGSGAAARTSVGGVIFGIDRTFGSGVVGIAVGIDDVRTDAAGGDSADGTLFQAVVYGGARRGRAFVDWQADYLRMDQDVTRSGGRFGASAKGGDTLEGAGGQINTGLGFTARRWRIEPTVGLSLLRLTSTATTESGGATTASIAGQRNHSLQSFAGVRLARMVRLTPDLSLQMRGLFGWSHEMEDVNAEARASLVRLGGPAFTVASAPTGRDAAKLGASFSAQVTSRVTVYGAYAADLARDREAQQVSVGVRARW